MNLKLRLNLIITMLLLMIMAIGVIYAVKNARKNVQVEVASTAILALHMLDSEIAYHSNNINTAMVTGGSIFSLKSLKDVRHVKISFYDMSGKLRDRNWRESEKGNEKSSIPHWFIKVMDSVTNTMPETRRHVFNAGHMIGELVLTPDPSYEIAEIWQEAIGLFVAVGLFFIIGNIIIYFFVGKALKPIDNILQALTEIESGNLQIRLPQFTLPELTKISEKFNVMATTLQESVADNRHLTQQMITIQEDERRNLARELHDEIGQHLTAIHIDASTIMNAETIEETRDSASAIDIVARQMMDIVRTILQRLRPISLDELGLDIALQELISSWNQRYQHITVNYQFRMGSNDFGERVSITIYRLIQECLTNIARHAEAKNVDILISQRKDEISLAIIDDGKGFDLSIKQRGFGLAGMRERVEGLAGKLEIMTSANQGVSMKIDIPVVNEFTGFTKNPRHP